MTTASAASPTDADADAAETVTTTLSSSRFLPQQNLLIQFPKHIFITSFNDIICRI